MNRALLDPFQAVELPEVVEEHLTCASPVHSVAFNHTGSLLAAGCANGQVVVFDFETRGAAVTLSGHREPVSSLAWSRGGQWLVSGSLDQRIIRWDMRTGGTKESEVELEGKVVRVSLHPREPHLCLASFALGAPVLADFAEGSARPLPALTVEGDGKASRALSASSTVTALALFDRRGMYAYVGMPQGTLAVLDASSLRFVEVIKVPGASRILDLCLNRKGNSLLVSCYDRIIRLYETTAHHASGRRRSYSLVEAKSRITSAKVPKSGSLLNSDEPVLKLAREFQNAVDRNQWRAVAFTADSEHVVGASAAKNEHNIYLFSRFLGKLERILEGPKEGVVAMAWHPVRSLLASVGGEGRIFLWAKIYHENWSAFAPDFQELDENQEYVEREDEFDINPRPEDQAPTHANGADQDSGDEVDILGVEPAGGSSSEDEGRQLPDRLPRLPVRIAREASPPPPPPVARPQEDSEQQDSGLPEERARSVPHAGPASEGARSTEDGMFDSEDAEDLGSRQRRVKLKVRFNERPPGQQGPRKRQRQ